MGVDERQAVEDLPPDDAAVGDDHAQLGVDAEGVFGPGGDGEAQLERGRLHGTRSGGSWRPRRLSGRVTTRATSWPASTIARRARAAASGVPRKAMRRT